MWPRFHFSGYPVNQDLTSASVQRTLFVRADHGSTVEVSADWNNWQRRGRMPLDFRRLQHPEPGNHVRRQYEGAIPDSGWLQR